MNMVHAVIPNNNHPTLSIMDAIYGRRAVRKFTEAPLSRATIHNLLFAAVQAPSAMHREPWAFAVIQNREVLKQLSDSAKKLLMERKSTGKEKDEKLSYDLITRPDFNIFYNAGTLIVIYGRGRRNFVAADCWLAAQNLMLAAYAAGLGSCVIGLAVEALNTREWKKELEIPTRCKAIAPIIFGYPADTPQPTPRHPPEVLSWRE